MNNQLKLFRTEALVKIKGGLYLVELGKIKYDGEPVNCPVCKQKLYVGEPVHGWLECQSCFNFAILETHYNEIKEQWNLL